MVTFSTLVTGSESKESSDRAYHLDNILEDTHETHETRTPAYIRDMDLNRRSSSGTPIGPPPIAGVEQNSAPTTDYHVPAWARTAMKHHANKRRQLLDALQVMKNTVQGTTTAGAPETMIPKMDAPVSLTPKEAPTAPKRRPCPRLPDPEIFDGKTSSVQSL
jgi:hypothetical protein